MKKLLFLYSMLLLASSLFSQEATSKHFHYPVPFRSCTKWGFVEYGTKKKVTNFEYDEVGAFYSGRAWVKKDNLYGYVFKSGGLVIPIQYEKASDFDHGAAKVDKGEKEFWIDTDGEEVKKPYDIRDDWCYTKWHLPFISTKIDDKYAFAKHNEDNLIIIQTPALYDSIIVSMARDILGHAFALKNGKWGVINEKNETVSDFMWDNIHYLKNTYEYRDLYPYFAVSQNNKWALADAKGKLLTPYKYEAIGERFDDLNYTLMAKPFNADWGYIDIEGTEYFEERGEGCLNERIDFTQEMQLSANPNPFSDEITAYFQLAKEAKTVKISLSDLSGKIIYEEVLEDLTQGKHEYTLHPKDLTVGIYVLHIDSKKGGASLRVQKY